MNRTSNLVSAIIPCYNDGRYIHDAINSILSQTYKQIEVIVVNDGSKDGETLRILDTLDRSKITVYHKENGGVCSARNYGIERSSGEYILTLDSDDKYAPDFVEKGLKILEVETKIGMVTSYVKQIKGKISSDILLTGGDIKDFLSKNRASASLLFRRQCWKDAGGYDEEIPGFADWEYCINVTKQGWIIYSIPEILFYYTNREGSMFDRVLKNSPEIIKYMVQKHKDVYQEHIVDVMYERECMLRELRNSESKFKNSVSQKIGSLILYPIRWLR